MRFAEKLIKYLSFAFDVKCIWEYDKALRKTYLKNDKKESFLFSDENDINHVDFIYYPVSERDFFKKYGGKKIMLHSYWYHVWRLKTIDFPNDELEFEFALASIGN